MKNKIFWTIGVVSLTIMFIYGAGRAYFYVTDGFAVGNITSELAYDPRWNTRPLNKAQWGEVEKALSQPYHYFSKGCQSYVFESEDHQYVLKFIKYQRFRNHFWVDWIGHLPVFDKYIKEKNRKKRKKLENILSGWCIAYEELKNETGVIYVHLNKTDEQLGTLSITDKMGVQHELHLDEMEFMIQRKARMLTETIHQLMANEEQEAAKTLLGKLLKTILLEYEMGISDNDQALMQNTGVLDGNPIHIDIGQFVHRRDVQNPQLMKQQLFNRTYLFIVWLNNHYPELGEYFGNQVAQVIGPQISELKYQIKDHDAVWEGDS